MSLQDQIKARVKAAMKAKDLVERDVLRVALGDLQTEQSRRTEPLAEAEEQAVLRRMVKSMDDTLAAGVDEATRAHVTAEKAILTSLLPQTLTQDQIASALEPVTEAVKAAANDGAAMGVAMKHLKAGGSAVDGKDVSAVVKRMRG